MIKVGLLRQGRAGAVCVEEIGAPLRVVYKAIGLFCYQHHGCNIRSVVGSEADVLGDEYRVIFDGPGGQFIDYELYVKDASCE